MSVAAKQFFLTGGVVLGFIIGGIFFLPSNDALAVGCCQILTSTGKDCKDMDVMDFCACDKMGDSENCKGVEWAPTASCNTTKKVCQLPSKGSSKGSSKPSGTSAPKKPSSSASTPATTKPKTDVWGGPTNLGNPKGTPKEGGSLFLPECATDEGQGPGHGCRDVGAFISLFVNYANGTLAIIGAVAFLFFIYGGVMLLISAGEAERVKKGRDVIMGAIIGILIVFGAQMLVRFVIQGLVPAEYQNKANSLQVTLPDSTTKAK
ncbi:MAG: hypothetical protein UX10_C0007G0021 [Candidatus Magasanikbacteria bacterium GW2011_GWA2_45_39]|uniref:Uncharacterized protein n=1 Tax=Candidatus Magasanikbacteria bacterium GW2011_GWA2_45_39 TaxID=1619041 RepID=A0A0G1QGE6_9BACT|nr:MAG: hypothetical protein UX10_C0007G0021 [Candidatus Magasanikbacteria bacterium GW2011_GWA2_45_39]HBW74253.1 hypothetical protein [Candidatus Magasanikbacteria bacterium]